MKFRVIVEVDENPKPDKEMLESNPEYGEDFMRRRAAAIKKAGASGLVTRLSLEGYIVRQIEEID